MASYYLSAQVTVSAVTRVEADSVEEAMGIAESRDVVLGGIGSGAEADEQWIVEDADGTPENIEVISE